MKSAEDHPFLAGVQSGGRIRCASRGDADLGRPGSLTRRWSAGDAARWGPGPAEKSPTCNLQF